MLLFFSVRNAVVLFINLLTIFIKSRYINFMDFDYLVYNDLLHGVKSLHVNGKKNVFRSIQVGQKIFPKEE